MIRLPRQGKASVAARVKAVTGLIRLPCGYARSWECSSPSRLHREGCRHKLIELQLPPQRQQRQPASTHPTAAAEVGIAVCALPAGLRSCPAGLPDPHSMDEWIRVLRPGGRSQVIVNSRRVESSAPARQHRARGAGARRRAAYARPRARSRQAVADATRQWFVPDSPLEGAVTSELVSGPEFPASWENTGKFLSQARTLPRIALKRGGGSNTC